MPVSFIDDDEEQLPFLDDPDNPNSFAVGDPSRSPSFRGMAPPAHYGPSTAIPPEAQRIIGGRPNPGTAPVSQAVDDAQQKLAAAKGNIPKVPQPKWWQRLAAGAVGFGAGYANAEGKRMPPIDPTAAEQGIMGATGYQRQLAQHGAEVQAAQANADAATNAEQRWWKNRQLNSEEELKAAESQKNLKQADYYEGRDPASIERAKQAGLTQRMKNSLKGREEDATYQKEGDPIPQGYETIQDLQNPGYVYVVPPSRVPLTDDLAKYAPGRKVGDVIPWSEWKKAQGAAQKVVESQAKPTNPNAEAQKIAFQNTVAKVAAENGIQASALSNTGQLLTAIRNSKTLTPEEKNNATGYLAANNTPAATGTAATIRVEGLGSMREMPVIDTKNGNRLQYLSATDINKSNQNEPGRYIPASQGTQALNRTALIEDIRGSIGQARDSLNRIPEFTPGDKAMIAMAMRDRDPRSAVSQLIGGAAGGHMTPDQQEYLINLAQLHEQAMAMRSVLGAGQGSEDLRAAILRTIPGPGTPNKAYAQTQLDKFEQTLNRLSRGVPNVPLRDNPQQNAPQQSQQNANPKAGDTEQHNGDTYVFDGQVWRKQQPGGRGGR